ncbi:nitrous oxide reductase family maturation protein NosD [Sediminibacterium goheungense]|uniref:Nitrous oxidase accessory protein n=1 Tax=Sediminibacterium goheungense TaxID=1086393 RepID=A0A4R6IV59_9BACT|nr:nitrous oxide reductase family maturation protein NosD [Sediminibacterium goheungense]TDO26510.1 nitrous oxidase accessory protein [Sediminibacterium goheungense]
MRAILLYILLLLMAKMVDARNITVHQQSAIRTIRQALALAKDGDTIRVTAGVYREKGLVIKKSIVLTGINYPVIDGEYRYEVIAVRADAVTIEGMKVINSGISSMDDFAGIKIYNSSHVIIRNNVLSNTFFGIYSQLGNNCVIENNQLTSFSKNEQQSGNGIHCWKSDSMQITNNRISGHRDGIYFEFVTHSIISRNIAEKNLRYGLHFMFSSNDSYLNNQFRNNGAGVAVMFSHHVTMLNNLFTQSWGDAAYGILLKEISDSRIESNQFVENTVAIFLEGANRIKVQKNRFQSNGWAMKIQASCMDITVIGNNFLSNTFDVGTNGSLVLNTFSQNYWDKYEGYDLDKNNRGDIPYRPVSMYAVIVERNPTAMILFRSFMTSLFDKTEKLIPSLTPENLKDASPLMKPLKL